MNAWENEFCKEIKIRVFGSAMKNSSKNDFQCLVTFWNAITENFKIYTLTQPKIKIKTLSKRKKEWDWREKEWHIEGKIDRLGKREIRGDGGRRRPDWMGLGVEWSGLVVGGGQIGDIKQEGEQDQCVENELGLGWVENEIDFGWIGLEWLWFGWRRRWASNGNSDLSLSGFTLISLSSSLSPLFQSVKCCLKVKQLWKWFYGWEGVFYGQSVKHFQF